MSAGVESVGGCLREPCGNSGGCESPGANEGGDFSPRITPPYLIGVYLAINAIPDAYLFLDGPSCFPLKSPAIQGNHDWFSAITNVSGRAKCITTQAYPSTVFLSREELYAEALRGIAAYEDAGGVFMSARPMAAITGQDYERVVRQAQEETSKPMFLVPPKSLQADWLGGYSELLISLAKTLELSGSRTRGKVAVVGYLFDRNEGDHEGNLMEMRRLLGAMDLDVSSIWLSGSPIDALRRAGEADAIVSLPYGRKAARILAKRLGIPLIETELPLGFGASERFLGDIGRALDRREQAEAVIDAELSRWAPRLEWVIPFVFQHLRLGFIGDPYLLSGVAEIAEMLGAKLSFAASSAHDSHLRGQALPIESVIWEPTKIHLAELISAEIERGLGLLVSCSPEMPVGVPVVELGYPSYQSHALIPRPYLFFSGTVGLVESMSNRLRQEELR
ncbi:MAG: hypothetical protein OEY14_06220 [Myxococcales bacterium]|nr:hypothetical protein [Myxococcales bacterium]